MPQLPCGTRAQSTTNTYDSTTPRFSLSIRETEEMYRRSQKNVSNIVQFRFIKRYFPFGLFPVFGGFTVRFLSHVSFRSFPFRFVSFMRLHNGAEIVGRASHSASGGTPTFKKGFARLFFVAKSVKNVAGKRQVIQRGSLSSTKRAAFQLRAERYETKRNEKKRYANCL